MKNKKILFIFIFFVLVVLLNTPSTYSIYKEKLSKNINLTVTDSFGYVVNFNTMGGSSIDSRIVTPNEAVGTLPIPVKEDYNFIGWYDENGNKVDYSEVITSTPITFYAHWEKVVCKRVTTNTALHTETCSQTQYGCYHAGYSNGATITYGGVPEENSFIVGDAYDCDINNDGIYNTTDQYGKYTERFYYIRQNTNNTQSTGDDTAVLVFYTAFDENGRVDSQHTDKDDIGSYNYTDSLTHIPNSSDDWDNPKLVQFGNSSARHINNDDVETSCGFTVSGSSVNLNRNCVFLLENSRFQSENFGRSGIWIEETSDNQFWRLQSHSYVYEKKDASSINQIKPVIEIPLNTLDGYLDEDEFTISFNTHDGDPLNGITRYRGQQIGNLPTPNRSGYAFENWYTDAGYTNLVDSTVLVDSNITLHAKWVGTDTATVTFNLNGGTGVPSTMIVNIGSTISPWQVPTYQGKAFRGWYEDDETFLIPFTETDIVQGNLILYAKWETISGVAEVNGVGYPTLQAAINAVPNTGVKTTVSLLQDISITQSVTISSTRNVELDMRQYEITGTASSQLIENYGTLEIKNGSITSTSGYVFFNRTDATLNISGGSITYNNPDNVEKKVLEIEGGTVNITGGTISNNSKAAAINVNGGFLNVSGGTITGTNTYKGQAIYNDGGTTTISGTTRLENTSKDDSNGRAALHNNSGTVNILGGTIISNAFSAVKNNGTMTIGANDGTISTSLPVIQGAKYGLEITNNHTVTVYDGIFKSINSTTINPIASTNILTNIVEWVTGEQEIIDSYTYNVAYLRVKADYYNLIFNHNNGTALTTVRSIVQGDEIGTDLPSAPTWEDHMFDGWYTELIGGTEVTSETVPDDDKSYYGHWTPNINTATISPSSISILTNGTSTITVTPTTGMESYTFASSDTSVATVTNGGVVTGISAGTTTITITGDRSEEVRSISVTVTDPTYSIIFTHNDGTALTTIRNIVQGSKIGTNLPSAPTWEDHMFDGWFTEFIGGTEVTSETIPDDDKTYYGHWTPNINTATISPNLIDIVVNETDTITVTPTTGMESYTFASSDTSVATVTSDGVVTGVGAGTTTITITGDRSNEVRVVNVIVVTERLYTVTFKDGSSVLKTVNDIPLNGTVGGAMPTNPVKSGYVFEKWYISGNQSGTFTSSTPITGDTEVFVKWKEDITTATVTPDPLTIVVGYTAQFTVTATGTGYSVEDYNISSSNTNILSIDSNKVMYGEDVGDVTLTLTGVDSGLTKTISATVTGQYTVNFESDGVIYDTKYIDKDTAIGNNLPTPPTKANYVFVGWYTTSTEPYTTRIDENTIINEHKTYYARWASDSYHAEMNNELYTSVQAAVDAATTEQTTIRLLKSVTYSTLVNLYDRNTDKNIVFDLNNFTLQTNTYVIRSKANIEIKNGNIISTGGSGAVESNEGSITIKDVNISNTNNRQAVYNDGGIINIYGDCTMTAKPATNSTRGVIHNNKGTLNIYNVNAQTTTTGTTNGNALYVKAGTVNIYGGTFEATSSSSGNGIKVDGGTLTIGRNDGTHDTSSIVIIGQTNGINTNQNISFYDGIIKSPNAAINNESKITNTESGFNKVNDTETIGGTTYNTLYYQSNIVTTYYKINYNPNSGVVSRNYDEFTVGEEITASDLPTPTRENYTFVGWCTDSDLQNLFAPFTPSSSAEVTYYAKWSYNASLTPVLHVITSDAMTTYFNNVASWVEADASDPTNSDTDTTNDHYNFFSNMNTTFTNNSCSSCNEGNGCSSPTAGTYCEQPKGYDTGFNQAINVYPYVNNAKENEIASYITVENGVIYNMIPGKSYYWELASDNTVYGIVTATGNRRTLYSPIRNLRDLGGMSVDTNNDGTPDGTLKYGILFRGAQNASGQTGVNSLTKLGITREIDLRADGDGNNGQTHLSKYDVDYNDSTYVYPDSVVEKDEQGNLIAGGETDPTNDAEKGYKDIIIRNYIINPTTTNYFDTAHLDNYKEFKAALKAVMRQVAAGDTIYFHCTIGTDRTGTLAYFLEGLLGVPLEERLEDYELTYFYGLTNRHRFHNISNQTLPFQISFTSSINPRFEAMYKSYDTYQKIYDFYRYIPESDDDAVLAAFRQAMIQ